MKKLATKVLYSVGIALLCGSLQAQTLNEAKQLYEEEKYAEAKPAFEKFSPDTVTTRTPFMSAVLFARAANISKLFFPW